MRPRILALVAVLTALVLAAGGCGDDDSDEGNGGGGEPAGGGGGSASTLKLSAPADGAIKFDKTSLSTKPGKVTIDFDNPSDVPHAVEVEGNGVEEETKTLTEGKADVTVDLKAGKYEFYCPVDGHRAGGMEGTLTVG